MAYRPYSQVAQALQNVGNTLYTGFRDIGDARMSAAEFALRKAQTEHEMKKEEFMFPGLQLQRKKDQQALAREIELDQPLDQNYLFRNTFNPDDVKGYEIEHYFANDIPGTAMNAMGIRYDAQQDRFFDKAGNQISKRQFWQAVPVYQSVILSKTDYVKRAKDELREAIKNKDTAKINALRKALDDPNKQFHLDTYDAQEKALIEQKAQFSQLPEGTVNLQFIDDSIDRIRRKRNEITTELMFNKKLAATNKRASKEWTSEQRVKAFQWADQRAREELETMREQGLLTKKEPGMFYGTNDVPWTREDEEAWLTKRRTDLMIEQAAVAGYLVSDTDAKADSAVGIEGKTGATGPDTGKAKPGSWSEIKAQEGKKLDEANAQPVLPKKPANARVGGWLDSFYKKLDNWEKGVNANIDQYIEDVRRGKTKGPTTESEAKKLAEQYGFKFKTKPKRKINFRRHRRDNKR